METRDKDGHHIMTKRLIHQEDIWLIGKDPDAGEDWN